MPITTWIVSPVFRDVESFLRLRQDVDSEFNKLVTSWPELGLLKYAVIDDSAGQDDEISRLRGLPDVLLLTPHFHLGHQRAIVYGLRNLPSVDDRDFVVTMDADGEDRPKDIPRLLDPLLTRSSDLRAVSLAWRIHERESAVHIILSGLYGLFFRLLTGQVIKTGNFAIFRGLLLKHIIGHPSFDRCYTSALTSLNLKSAFVACLRGTRYAGHSRMKAGDRAILGIQMMMPHLDRIAMRSLVVFGVTIILSFTMSLAVVAMRLFTNASIPGWASSSLLALGILTLLSIGNFIVLFAVYSQSRGSSLHGIEPSSKGWAQANSPD